MQRLNQALREVRMDRGLRQRDVAQSGYVSHQLVSKVERGKGVIATDVARRIAEAIDDPKLFRTLLWEVTGGVFAPPPLDGPAADLHRSAVKERTLAELAECLTALQAADTATIPDRTDEAARRLILEAIQEAIDVQTAIAELVSAFCRAYGLSAKDQYRQHAAKLRERHYLA